MNNRPFDAGSFFLLRTPLLPTRKGWPDDESRDGADHDSDPIFSDPAFREALALSSENLSEKLKGDAVPDERLMLALTRYRRRMATRCTPFGASAAVTVGEIGGDSATDLGEGEARRICRLDQGVVQTLLDNARAPLWGSESRELDDATLTVNSGSWKAPDGYRFVELVDEGGLKRHRLSKIKLSPAIDAALEILAQGPKTVAATALALADALGAPQEASKAFLVNLAREQLLLLGPQSTACSEDAVVRMLRQLGDQPWAREAASALSDSLAILAEVSADPAENVRVYRRVQERLEREKVIVESGKLVHVDLRRDSSDIRLSQQATTRLADALWAARGLITRRGNPMTLFVNEFIARYGDGEAPLLEVLDDDFGVKFGPYGAAPSPLIAALGLGNPTAASRPAKASLETILARRLSAQDSDRGTLDLTAEAKEVATDFNGFAETFSTIGSFHGDLSAWEAGQGWFEPKIVHTPAMALFGRFCAGSPELLGKVRAFVDEYEPDRDDCIYAEVVHLPHGRVGNVALRPSVRDYELTYLSATEKPAEFEVPAADLWVRVVEGEVRLFCKTSGKRIIPRLTTAHNFEGPASLPIYRFLGALQKQFLGEVGWIWPLALSRLPFLPRVTCGPLILSRARWRLEKREIGSGLDGLRSHLAARQVPSHVSVRVGDNFLELRLDVPGDLELLLEELRRADQLDLDEAFDDENLITGANGERFRQEYMIPFGHRARAHRDAAQEIQPGPAHTPGGRWLYAQVFAGPTMVDDLARSIFPKFAAAIADSGGSRPFFIRYNEGGMHLRIRACFANESDQFAAMQALNEMLAPRLASRSIHKIRYDTYFPEYNRYGGVAAMADYEELFSLDSRAASEALEVMARSADPEGLRWRFAALSLRGLVTDLIEDPDDAVRVVGRMAKAYTAEFDLSKAQSSALKDTFRFYKPFFDQVAEHRPFGDAALEGLRAVVQRRSAGLRPVVARLRTIQEHTPYLRSIESVLHMAANRVFLESARAHELVLFACLEKSLSSMAARTRHHGAKVPAE